MARASTANDQRRNSTDSNRPARTSRKKAPASRPNKTALNSRAERLKDRSDKKSGASKKTENSSGKNNELTKSEEKPKKQFIETERVIKLTERTLPYIKAGYPVHLTGPTGVGKTAFALHLARQFDRPVMMLHGNHEMNNADLLGDISGVSSDKLIDNFVRQVYKEKAEIKEKWNPGRLVEAVKKGYTVVYDEFSRSHPETNNLFLSVLEEGYLPLYGTKQKTSFIKVHKNFRMIFTSNPEEYAGVFNTQDALTDRMITIEMKNDRESDKDVLRTKTEVLAKEADLILKIISKIRNACRNENRYGPGLRSAIMIASVCKSADIRIEAGNERFNNVCKDILGQQIVACTDAGTYEEAEKWFDNEIN